MFQTTGEALQLRGLKTYAPPVWRNSTRKPVRFESMHHKERMRIWDEARRRERMSRPFNCQDGDLGRNGLAVLHVLLFVFLDLASGRLDPGYEAIAKAACISRSSVYRGLTKLREAGILEWVRRCEAEVVDGRFTLRQITNAYAIQPPEHWRAYTPSPRHMPPPKPDASAWGATPPLAGILDAPLRANPKEDVSGALAHLLAAIRAKNP